jgi:RNA polymerase sigma factor for flagellar operon FliA
VTPEIEALVQEIIPQARSEAWRAFQKAPHALDREELESIALTGLVQAASMWDGYCARNHYDPAAAVDGYFHAYALRRMRGAILDHLRSVDWVTRNTRQRAKRLQAAGEGQGSSEVDLAASTGLSRQQIRETRAAVANRPVSLDEGERDVAEAAGAESTAMVSLLLAALASAREDLLPEAQVVLALRYYEGRSLTEIAAAVGHPLSQVSSWHDGGVRAVRQAMLRVVA